MLAQTPKLRSSFSSGLAGFVVLPENRSAQRAIRRLAASEILRPHRQRPFPILYLHGAPGSGKSHLVKGLLERVICRSPGKSARCVPARELGRLLSMNGPSLSDPGDFGGGPSFGSNAGPEFRGCDLLVVEDVQHLPAHAAESLASLIDHRRNRRGAVVVTGASGPAMLKELPARLTSRLTSGLVVGLEPLSRASRRALARALIDQSGLHVTDEVVDWLARQPGGGARPILGDLARLKQLSQLLPPPLDLAAVTSRLPAAPEEDCSPLDRLARRVAEHFRIKPSQLSGRARHRHLLWPRHVGMYLARKLTGCSLVRIGAYFGGYDHSTVLHACRQVEQKLTGDDGIAGELKLLHANLL